MSENKPQSINEVAIALNLPIREPKNDPLTCYVNTRPEELVTVVRKLKNDYGVYFISTVIVRDDEDGYHLLYPFSVMLADSTWRKLVLDIRVDKSSPEVDSITPELPGAIIAEREAYDMMGVTFRNHPDHRRLLTADIMPSDLYPLRKEHTFQEIRERLAKEAEKRRSELE
ncbi:MAG: NADH-quinone oxidoreductase subunit C [Candidatus Hodarchaeales archaeon]|jgi:Ni,Fe-hydrogenase III component G